MAQREVNIGSGTIRSGENVLLRVVGVKLEFKWLQKITMITSLTKKRCVQKWKWWFHWHQKKTLAH